MRRLLVLCLACVASVAHAQPGAEVTVDQAIAAYREHSARRLADRAEIDVTEADVVDANVYPNPTLGVGTTRTLHGSDTIGRQQIAGSIDVPLLIGGQRQRRGEAARARVVAKRAEVAAGEGEAELAIRARFAALQAAQQRTTTLAAAVEDTQAARTIVAGRAAAGANSAYELERIDLALASLASRLAAQRADEEAASADLAAAVGVPGWHPRAAGTLVDPAAATAVTDSTPAAPVAVSADHPTLAIARAEEASARAEEAQAHADATPTPSLGLQAFQTTDPAGLAVGIGLTLPLPLFDRNQGAVARARAAAHHTALELAARSTELALALDAASRQLEVRRAALAAFRAGALERLPRLRAMAESAYKTGQGGIVGLLDALDAITETRMREIELAAAVADAELAVRTAAAGR